MTDIIEPRTVIETPDIDKESAMSLCPSFIGIRDVRMFRGKFHVYLGQSYGAGLALMLTETDATELIGKLAAAGVPLPESIKAPF